MMVPTARFGGAGGHFYSQKHLAPLLGASNGAISTIQCRAERHSLCPWSADLFPSTWPHWDLPKGMGRGPAHLEALAAKSVSPLWAILVHGPGEEAACRG